MHVELAALIPLKQQQQQYTTPPTDTSAMDDYVLDNPGQPYICVGAIIGNESASVRTAAAGSGST